MSSGRESEQREEVTVSPQEHLQALSVDAGDCCGGKCTCA